MAFPSSHEITGLLQAWRQGDQSALEQLVPLVEAELHRLAHRYLAGERPGHTLQTTARTSSASARSSTKCSPASAPSRARLLSRC